MNNNDITEYLVVMIGNKFTWKTHTEHICSKIARGAWALTRLKKYINKQTLIKIYYFMIYSHFRYLFILFFYCKTIMSSASKTTLIPHFQANKPNRRINQDQLFALKMRVLPYYCPISRGRKFDRRGAVPG